MSTTNKKPLRDQLVDLRALEKQAREAHPPNRHLAEAQRGQAKAYRAQIDELLDKMVDEARGQMIAIIPSGDQQGVRRFADLAAKSAIVIDANAAYRDLCAELAVRCGVAKFESGNLVSVDRARQQLTSDHIGFLMAASQPAWLSRNYYAAKGARGFNHPTPPHTNDVWFSNLSELIERVKERYAPTNQTHEISKVAALAAIRQHVSDKPAPAAAIILNTSSPGEERELAAIFGGSARPAIPADLSRKAAAGILDQILGKNETSK